MYNNNIQASPGGIWRTDRNATAGEDSTSTNMYEALWTNGPKEAIEFFDYTFDEHFGRGLPMYMPRQLILDYMLARCTKDNPNFFDNVKFNTSVKSVNYDQEMAKFVVETVDLETEEATEGMFDRCIWAAGGNGKPKIPQSISSILSSGEFKGTVMHSSETGSDFDKCVKGKKILIIGDSYSAEDLTLEAIKLGCEQVDILSRSGTGIAYDCGSWPRDCVDVHYAYKPTGVTNEGRGIVLSNGSTDKILEEVDTVIYGTGYLMNMDMLHPSLRPQLSGPYFTEYEIDKQNWKMPKNALSKEFGEIPLGTILQPPHYVRPDIYRSQLMSNPNMMFFIERTDVPIFDLDITAWLMLAHIMGDLLLPSVKEMQQFNLETLSDVLKDPVCRGYDDENYKNRWWAVNDDHWTYNYSDKRMKQMIRQYTELQYRLLARDMVDAKYPLQIGTYNKLNEKGKALVEFNQVCGYARYDLDWKSPEASWRTFRDCNPTKCYSILTGTRAVPLKCHWLDMKGDAIDDIVDKGEQQKVGKGKSKSVVKTKLFSTLSNMKMGSMLKRS